MHNILLLMFHNLYIFLTSLAINIINNNLYLLNQFLFVLLTKGYISYK